MLFKKKLTEEEIEKKEKHEAELKRKAIAKLDITREKRDSKLHFCKPGEVGLPKWIGLNIWSAIVWFGFTIAILYRKLDIKFPTLLEFFRFWMIGNFLTIIQFVLLPLLTSMLFKTNLANIDFKVLPIGGDGYYIFDYSAGDNGGLAYFLAVEIVLLVAQIIGFPLQRNIAFKSKGNPWFQGMWYLVAFVLVTFIAGAAQGFYKQPLYDMLMNTWSMGEAGRSLADMLVAWINCIIQLVVFFPIYKIIFPNKVNK